MKTLLFAAMIAVPVSAMAADRAVAKPYAPGGECVMKENVTVNVQYNFKAESFAAAKKQFDEQNAKVQEFAKKQELGKLELQNQNYNIYSQPLAYGVDGQPSGYQYQLNGSSSYRMDNADAAFKFAEFLNQQKIQVGMSSNSHRQGNCNN